MLCSAVYKVIHMYVSYVYMIHIYSFSYIYILFHYGLSQDTQYSSLCYTVGPCCSSVLYLTVCIY